MQCIDDEDDEPTLSTDYCGGSSIEKDPPSGVTETSTSPSSISLKTVAESITKPIAVPPKEIPMLGLVALGEPLDLQHTVPSTSVKAIISPADVEPKCSKIQKQISLYEREYSTEFKQLKQDVAKFTRTPSSGNVAKRWTEITSQNSSHISADSLHQSLNIGKHSDRIPGVDKVTAPATKTMSCINLKTYIGTPGAVLVKEKFIEPPLRVAKSFHGNTSFLTKCNIRKAKISDLRQNDVTTCVSTDSVFKSRTAAADGSPQKSSAAVFKNRFTATKVDETVTVLATAENVDGKIDDKECNY